MILGRPAPLGWRGEPRPSGGRRRRRWKRWRRLIDKKYMRYSNSLSGGASRRISLQNGHLRRRRRKEEEDEEEVC